MGFSFQPLRDNLKDRNIDRQRFAFLTGLSASTVSKIYKDDSVSMDVLDRICARLGLKIEEVVEYMN